MLPGLALLAGLWGCKKDESVWQRYNDNCEDLVVCVGPDGETGRCTPVTEVGLYSTTACGANGTEPPHETGLIDRIASAAASCSRGSG